MTSIATPPIGKLIQKHHLQLRLVVKTPPSSGPRIEDSPSTILKYPLYKGLFVNGTADTMSTMAPDRIPALPIPAIALPKMNILELVAAPHIALPISNRPTKARKTYFGE